MKDSFYDKEIKLDFEMKILAIPEKDILKEFNIRSESQVYT